MQVVVAADHILQLMDLAAAAVVGQQLSLVVPIPAVAAVEQNEIVLPALMAVVV